jgi:hypothetical protein
LATGVFGWISVERRLARLVAEVVCFALVFRLVFRSLLIHFHSTNRIFRQIPTSSSEIMFEAHELVVRAGM